jgi:hypothetical protein
VQRARRCSHQIAPTTSSFLGSCWKSPRDDTPQSYRLGNAVFCFTVLGRPESKKLVTKMSMSTGDKNQQVGPGLGKPLVTIPTPGSISRGIAVPAGDNHPLAAATVSTNANVNAAQVNQGTNTVLGSGANNVSTIQAPPPAGQAPTATANANANVPQIRGPAPMVTVGSPVQARVVPTAVSPSKTLDALADAFLSERSYRTDQLDLAPVLRPSPLPREDGIYRLRTLVERRAWGDVLKISTNILNSPKDLHADVYASLVTLPLNAPEVDVSTVPIQIRQETVEIMTLQCHAWLKLRRYVDLATEVERWNFSKHNDATAQSPEWLPWSIRTCSLVWFGLVERSCSLMLFC